MVAHFNSYGMPHLLLDVMWRMATTWGVVVACRMASPARLLILDPVKPAFCAKLLLLAEMHALAHVPDALALLVPGDWKSRSAIVLKRSCCASLIIFNDKSRGERR